MKIFNFFNCFVKFTFYIYFPNQFVFHWKFNNSIQQYKSNLILMI